MEIQDLDLKTFIENETGLRFSKQLKINSPFNPSDKTPSFAIHYDDNAGKWKFKDFSTGKSGDIIDFCMEYRNMDYQKSREYLGLSFEKNQEELNLEKVENYINWSINNQEFRKDQKLIGIFKFEDSNNSTAYYKAKFKKMDGSKELSYYSIDNNGKVINKRNYDFELPYNLHSTINAIKENKILIFVEGERDVNRVNHVLGNKEYVAISIKNCKEKGINLLRVNSTSLKIYVCSDTGEAGEKYKWHIYNELFAYAEVFKFINLPGIKNLGDNKDVTDWLEAGHDKWDLLKAFDRSLDLKSRYELQQDKKGIYKTIIKEKDEEITYTKKYLTDFRLLEASRIKYVDEDQEGVKLVLKSPTGETIERTGFSTVFDDVRTFKNFLGTLDLAFKGRIDDLTDLKTWINKFFALEIEEIYNGVQFKIKDGELLFISNNGAIGKDSFHREFKSDGRNEVQITEMGSLTKDELKEIKKHLFRFASPEKTISIIGTVINNMTVAHCRKCKIKLHHLLIIGEAGSGKSTILENVIAPILNYPSTEIKSIGLATNFSLINDLSSGNYTMIYEEHKPSRWESYKISKISEILRNLYDASTVSRGDKSLKAKNFQLTRPIIMAGEESYYNNEKALLDRSCIIYTSKNERKKENSEAMKWIIEHEQILNKLGKELINIIINLSSDNYNELRNKAMDNIKDLRDRPLNTALNISMGIEILNILLKKNGIKTITGYMKYIIQNIKAEILDGGSDSHSIVEQMLVLYNSIIEDKRVEGFNAVVCRGDGVFIKTSEMLNQIRVYIKSTGSNIRILENRDFKKQAEKAGYLVKASNKLMRVDGKIIRFDTYNKELLLKLRVDAIVPPEVIDITGMDDNIINVQ